MRLKAVKILEKRRVKKAATSLISKLDDPLMTKPVADAVLSIGGQEAEILSEVIDKLRERIPSGETYDKERKIYEFLPSALRYRKEGFDFVIEYEAEKKHLIGEPVVITEIIRQESGFVFVPSIEPFSSAPGIWTVYKLSNGEESWYGTQDSDQLPTVGDVIIPAKWSLDAPEQLRILRGGRVNGGDT